MLNSIFYPNIGTAVYFVLSIFLTALCLSKDEKKIKLKQILCISIIAISLGILITKAVFIVDLNSDVDLTLDSDDALMYKTSGIYVTLNSSKNAVVNVFMSIFFDFMEFFLCIIMTILYGS